jgi:hypothetical protein
MLINIRILYCFTIIFIFYMLFLIFALRETDLSMQTLASRKMIVRYSHYLIRLLLNLLLVIFLVFLFLSAIEHTSVAICA